MIAIIDYGAGNLRSIRRALEAGGAEVEITSDQPAVRAAERVVLPGVGHAGAAMERLQASGLDVAIQDVAAAGKPLLGICLGMQLLFDYQEEGDTHGLNLLGGAVASLPPTRKVPHLGWNKVDPAPGSPIGPSDYFYFVHSYIIRPERPSDVAATTNYGITFPSVVIRDNIWGTQFHPEKSGESGLALVRAWLADDAAQSADAA